MTKLQSYIAKYGPAAGPKLYHALQSRAAYIGANSRRRAAIAGLTGRPYRARRPSRAGGPTPLLPETAATVEDQAALGRA